TPLSLSLGEANERVFGELVSANYFTTLGLKPALRRNFDDQENRTNKEGENMYFRLLHLAAYLLTLSTVSLSPMQAQTRLSPDEPWIGQRIVMLKGRGDFFEPDKNGKFQFVKGATNIVSVLKRIEGERLWLEAPSGRVGWVKNNEVILLDDAIQYFTSLIE